MYLDELRRDESGHYGEFSRGAKFIVAESRCHFKLLFFWADCRRHFLDMYEVNSMNEREEKYKDSYVLLMT